jgi:hypothetical protein
MGPRDVGVAVPARTNRATGTSTTSATTPTTRANTTTPTPASTKRYDYDKYRVNRCIHDDDGSPSGCQKHYSTAKKNNRRYDENLDKVNGRDTWSHWPPQLTK